MTLSLYYFCFKVYLKKFCFLKLLIQTFKLKFIPKIFFILTVMFFSV